MPNMTYMQASGSGCCITRHSNRSRAIQEAVLEKLERLERNRLAEECNKLDPAYERAMADEGLSEELDAWPKY